MVSFGGVTVLTDPPDDDGAFHHYSFVVDTTNTVLSFSFYNQPAWYTLDNVVVQLASGTATVPDAPEWALFIAGFGLSGAALRRRRVSAGAPA